MNRAALRSEKAPSIITGLSLKEAVNQLEQFEIQIDRGAYASLLRKCGLTKALAEGRQLHFLIARAGCDGDKFLGNLLVQMYSRCGSLDDARAAFDRTSHRNVFSWNLMAGGYAQNGLLDLARSMLLKMPQHDVYSWTAILTSYAERGYLQEARIMFDQMPEKNVVGWTAMCVAYAQRGHLDEARKHFHEMPERDVTSCNAMIAAYAHNAELRDAQATFDKMPQRDIVSWNTMLSAYVENGYLLDASNLFDAIPEKDVVSWNAISQAYIENGHLKDARRVFDRMPQRSVVSWNAMIQAYTENGHYEDARAMFHKMPERDVFTWNSMIHAFSGHSLLKDAKNWFDSMPQRTVVSWTAMLAAYAQQGQLQDARNMFYEMAQWNAVSWTVMVLAYAQHGSLEEASEMFRGMPEQDICSCNVMISAYAQNGLLQEARDLFARMPQQDVGSWNAIIQAYAQDGHVEDARAMFDMMSQRDVISWNSMVGAYAQIGHSKDAFKLFGTMDLEGTAPDPRTYATILDACATSGALAEGKLIHAELLDRKLQLDVFVWTALVNLYGRCGYLDEAAEMFEKTSNRDTASWNAMIVAYAKNGHGEDALNLFRRMDLEGVGPDEITYVSILDVCANLAALTEGRIIHENLIYNGYNQSDLVILDTALVNMYGSCGYPEAAKNIFDKMPNRDAAAWNSMISHTGHNQEALELFRKMDLEGVNPDEITYASILDVCGSLANLSDGMIIHTNATDRGLQSEVLGTALVNMYGKCGRLDEARRVFAKMPREDTPSWNAMLAVYAQNGPGKDVLKLFQFMQLQGINPDQITFVSILSACSHAGMLQDGWHCFLSIKAHYELALTVHHYMCMVDLLGRVGQLTRSEELIENMPFEPMSVAWTSMIGNCRSHGNLERAEYAAKKAFELEPENSALYVLLSNALISDSHDLASKLSSYILQ